MPVTSTEAMIIVIINGEMIYKKRGMKKNKATIRK
jgi:hypothetical protein